MQDRRCAGPVAIKTKRATLRVLVTCTCLVATPGAAAWLGAWVSYDRETERTEIYCGVYYQSYQGQFGAVHLVEIDLGHPGIELYMTPLDPLAVASGYQYRLHYVRNLARAERLAVAVNGALFAADSYLLPMVGDFATSVDSIISNHQINHLNPHDYVFWIDDQQIPHLETSRPIPPAVIRKAKWGIGAQSLSVRGSPLPHDGPRDRQTRLGINLECKRLWLGVFESASERDATAALMKAGAHYVLPLDGGDSASLYLGGRTHGTAGGLRFGGQRPVATIVGVKATPLLDPL